MRVEGGQHRVQNSAIRFTVDPRDVPLVKAARRLSMTEAAFVSKQDELFSRGFPRPDPTTGHFDLKAIDAWMDQRSSLTACAQARHAPQDLRDALHAWTPETPKRRKA